MVKTSRLQDSTQKLRKGLEETGLVSEAMARFVESLPDDAAKTWLGEHYGEPPSPEWYKIPLAEIPTPKGYWLLFLHNFLLGGSIDNFVTHATAYLQILNQQALSSQEEINNCLQALALLLKAELPISVALELTATEVCQIDLEISKVILKAREGIAQGEFLVPGLKSLLAEEQYEKLIAGENDGNLLDVLSQITSDIP